MAWEFPWAKYRATPPTLTDGDSVLPNVDVNGNLKVSEGVKVTNSLLATGSGFIGWLSRLVLDSEYFRRETMTLWGDVRTAQKHTILSFSARRPLSTLLFKTPVVGGGAVAQANNGEYRLSTTATAASAATLETYRRGAYVCGLPASFEMSVRIPAAPTNNRDYQWGYCDDNNGWRFGYDATGLYVAHTLNGVDTKIYQTNWNVDKVDGTGRSGVTLTPSSGVIYFIDFLWFGYGPVQWGVMRPGEDGLLHRIVLHRYQTQGQLNSASPYLPLRLKVVNGASGGTAEMFVGGAAFSVLGIYEPPRRSRCQDRLGFGLANSATEQHLFTIRHKSATPYESARLIFEALEVIVSADMIITLRFNATLTGGTWAAPTGVSATETVAEISTNTTVTAGSGDPLVSMIHAIQGRSDNGTRSFEDIDIPPDCTISVMVKSISPGNGQTCSVLARWFEEW